MLIKVMDNIMIYSPLITARKEYILTILFRDLIGLEPLFSSNKGEFDSFEGPCLEYSEVRSGHGLFIKSCGLLDEQDVKPQLPQLIIYQDISAIFPVSGDLSALPFDIFAASFYLISRYEEYLPFTPDRYGRFRASDSISVKGGFLTIPVVNLWAKRLSDIILKEFPDVILLKKDYRFVPTVDIDHVFAFKGRSPVRTIAGYCRDLVKGRIRQIAERTGVLLDLFADPYDQYENIKLTHERYGFSPLWFLLFADYGGDDNNVSLRGKAFKSLVRTLDAGSAVGIHPSLASHGNPGLLSSEIQGLSRILGRDISVSRQHFLKLSFPMTCRMMLREGISDDYSMGYSSHPGFRAGIANPFPFFDLEKNKAEKLTLHPVQLMDVTLKDYLKCSPVEALEWIRKMSYTIKAVNGEFVTVWHNESFCYSGRWKGWDGVYEELLSGNKTG